MSEISENVVRRLDLSIGEFLAMLPTIHWLAQTPVGDAVLEGRLQMPLPASKDYLRGCAAKYWYS